MPYVSATLAVTPSDELTARAVSALTELTVEILGARRPVGARRRPASCARLLRRREGDRGHQPAPRQGALCPRSEPGAASVARRGLRVRGGRGASRRLLGVCGRNPGAPLPQEQGRLE